MYEKEMVDVIIDVPQSACSLAVNEQARLHKKLFISVDSGTTLQTGAKCNYYGFDWGYDNYMLATAAGLWAADNLGKKWYAITADYAWGHDLLKNFKAAVEKKGGAGYRERYGGSGNLGFFSLYDQSAELRRGRAPAP